MPFHSRGAGGELAYFGLRGGTSALARRLKQREGVYDGRMGCQAGLGPSRHKFMTIDFLEVAPPRESPAKWPNLGFVRLHGPGVGRLRAHSP